MHHTDEQDKAVSRWFGIGRLPLNLEQLHARHDRANKVDIENGQNIDQMKDHGDG